jgi:hypothetical protein
VRFNYGAPHSAKGREFHASPLECLKMHIERPSETHARIVPIAL